MKDRKSDVSRERTKGALSIILFLLFFTAVGAIVGAVGFDSETENIKSMGISLYALLWAGSSAIIANCVALVLIVAEVVSDWMKEGERDERQ